MIRLRHLGTIAAVAAATTLCATTAFGGGQPLAITSSIDGKTVLPQQSRWLAHPNLAPANVAEVDFSIDGKLRWVEHSAPYTYGGDDNHEGSFNTASVTITKATQAITYTAFAATATAPGGTVTFSSGAPGVCTVSPTGAVAILGPGSCVIVASQGGSDNYQPAGTRSDQTVKQ